MRFTIWFVVGSPRAHGRLTLSYWEEEITRSNCARAMTPPQTKTTCLHVCMRSNTQKKHTCVAAEPVCDREVYFSASAG